MGSPAAQDSALNQSVTSRAWFSGPAVNGEKLLHLPAGAIGLAIGGVDTGALPLNA